MEKIKLTYGKDQDKEMNVHYYDYHYLLHTKQKCIECEDWSKQRLDTNSCLKSLQREGGGEGEGVGRRGRLEVFLSV
jgi:hypothetical protein